MTKENPVGRFRHQATRAGRPGREGEALEETSSSESHPFADLPPFIAALLENIESLVIAIIMALVLKFFVVEAYKIPTGSMQPTLMGDSEARINDRILVTKFLPRIRAPKRWEVWVFRYPHDITKNYIKRVVGLPGETLEILDGDIWIDGTLERKPSDVQASFWRIVSDLTFPGDPFGGEWSHTGDGIVRSEPEGLTMASGENETVSIRRIRPIRDSYLDGYPPEYGVQKRVQLDGRHTVGDLRLEIEGALLGPTEALVILVQDGARNHRFTIAGPQGNHSTSIASNGTVLEESPSFRLPSSGAFRIAAEHWDDTLRLVVNDQPLLESTYPGKPELHRRTSGVSLGVRSGSVAVKRLSLARDVFYVPYEGNLTKFHIPQDHFFVLGDNTLNSKDSRAWKIERFPLWNGRELVADVRVPGEEDPNPRFERIAGQPGQRVVDRYGETYHLSEDELDTSSGHPLAEYAHFVPGNLFLGRAFIVFWPVFRPFRIHLVR